MKSAIDDSHNRLKSQGRSGMGRLAKMWVSPSSARSMCSGRPTKRLTPHAFFRQVLSVSCVKARSCRGMSPSETKYLKVAIWSADRARPAWTGPEPWRVVARLRCESGEGLRSSGRAPLTTPLFLRILTPPVAPPR